MYGSQSMIEHMQVANWTGPGVPWSKCQLPACNIRCFCSMKIPNKSAGRPNGIIYWTPKETLQSSLLYYFIKCYNMAFLLVVNVVRDDCEDKCLICAVKRNFCRSIWTVCTTCTISLLPGIMKVKKKLVRSKGNIPKQREIIRNW